MVGGTGAFNRKKHETQRPLSRGALTRGDNRRYKGFPDSKTSPVACILCEKLHAQDTPALCIVMCRGQMRVSNCETRGPLIDSRDPTAGYK